MKISSSYLFDSALRNLQSSQTDVARSREQLASGKNLVRASDDTSKLRSIETLESVSYTHLTLPTICSV